MKREAVSRVEFDWWAADHDDHVAVFSTAGYGGIPVQVLDAYGDEPTEPELGHLLGQMTSKGGWREEGRGPGTCDEFRQLGAHGLFVFDWRPLSGPYERIIVPQQPLYVSDLPHAVREAIVLVLFAKICFSQVVTVVAKDHLTCE